MPAVGSSVLLTNTLASLVCTYDGDCWQQAKQGASEWGALCVPQGNFHRVGCLFACVPEPTTPLCTRPQSKA
eukprot:1157860-Pelagomonas_calceolata.AAC.6